MILRVLNDLSEMAGQNYAKYMRQNQLDALYVYLRTDRHLSYEPRKEIRNILQKAIQEDII